MININDTDIVKQARFHALKMEQDALKIILSSGKKGKSGKTATGKDSYIRQNQDMSLYADYTESGVLRSSAGRVTKEEIWDYLANFSGVIHNREFVVNGQLCTTGQIEKMGKDVLKEMKAVDNVLVLESGVYYGVTTNDGGTENAWGMNTDGLGRIHISRSESNYAYDHGITLKELGQWSEFFRCFTNRGDAAAAGIYLGFSESQVRDMMAKLGFQPGMCTIQADGVKNTFFYSNDGRLYPMYHYNGAYTGMTQGDNLFDYEPGEEFNYNGTIYTMDEEGHFNVPYGEDIFNCLSRPESKLAKKMRESKGNDVLSG